MPDTLIFARTKVRPENVAELDRNQAKTTSNLKSVRGFVGRSSWRDANDPVVHLTVYEYASSESAEDGLKVVVEGPILVESSKLLIEPPEVVQIAIEHRSGKRIHEVPVGSVMSVSARFSDPGRGEQLDRELETIFGELSALGGFLSALRGYRTLLEEERFGIVLWSNMAAFHTSLPKKSMYEVRAYKRIL